MSKDQKIEFIVNKDTIGLFIQKLNDITKISDNVRIKIDSDNILIYGLVGDTAILAFKSHLLNTSQFVDTRPFEYLLDFVIVGAKKWAKNFNFFEYKEKTKFILSFKDNEDNANIKNVRTFTIQDTNLKITQLGDQPNRLRDISKGVLEQKFNPKICNWSFNLNSDVLDKVKRISNNSDEKIITASIKDKKVYFSESSKWTLLVGDTELEDSIDISFDNSYLSNINSTSDKVEFHVFDTTILFKEEQNSNLLISFEQV